MQDRDDNHIEKQWQAACAERGDPDTDTNAANLGVGEREDGDGDIDQVGNLLERCDEVAGKVNGFLEEQFGEEEEVLRGVQEQTRIALGVIRECLERYRYVLCEGILRLCARNGIEYEVPMETMLTCENPHSLEEISFSYNGGKDCLVLLILLLAALSNHQSSSSSSSSSSKPKPKPLPLALPSVYILSPHPFPEVDTFVASSSAHYHLQLSRYASPMKEAFTQYLHDHPVVKAILVGTRRTDPHGADLTHFDLTDGGWPRFMRVHPVIDWHYREIWGVSFCYFIIFRAWGFLPSLAPFLYSFLGAYSRIWNSAILSNRNYSQQNANANTHSSSATSTSPTVRSTIKATPH